MSQAATPSGSTRHTVQWIGLLAGPLLAILCVILLDGSSIGSGTDAVPFTLAGRATLGLMVWMGTWWLTEAIDISATALLPVAILPIVTVSEPSQAKEAIVAAASPYANPFIALFLGGFILALSMERWGLHRRIALTTLRFVGSRPMAIVAGFMLITAVMSMWVSNTATTVMMLPIALSVSALITESDSDSPRRPHFNLCLMLGVAYAASVGGIGTLIGSPPNTLLAGFVQKQYGVDVSFARWLAIGLPIVVVFTPIIWLMLTRVLYPIDRAPIEGGAELIRDELAALGRMSRGEWATFIVFMMTAMGWMFRPLLSTWIPGLSDAGLAIMAAMALFAIPVDLRRRVFVMNWDTAKKVPWGILILFGGGLSLAAAVKRHGVADYLGEQAAILNGAPTIVIVLSVVTGVIFLTELTSNTATTATLLPILAGVAPVLGIEPVLVLVPAALAASCAFMMPVATPPNAIVFGSGHVTMPQMSRAGVWLNLIGIALVTAIGTLVAAPLLGSLG